MKDNQTEHDAYHELKNYLLCIYGRPDRVRDALDNLETLWNGYELERGATNLMMTKIKLLKGKER